MESQAGTAPQSDADPGLPAVLSEADELIHRIDVELMRRVLG